MKLQIESLIKNIRVLLRANSIVAEIQLRHILTTTIMRFMAGLTACFGLLMLDVACYFAIQIKAGSVNAALTIAIANLALAAIIFFISTQIHPGKELEIAREINENSLQSVTAELDNIHDDLEGLIHNPFDNVLSGLIRHLAETIISPEHKK